MPNKKLTPLRTAMKPIITGIKTGSKLMTSPKTPLRSVEPTAEATTFVGIGVTVAFGVILLSK